MKRKRAFVGEREEKNGKGIGREEQREGGREGGKEGGRSGERGEQNEEAERVGRWWEERGKCKREEGMAEGVDDTREGMGNTVQVELGEEYAFMTS